VDVICQECGEANPQGEAFCSNCKAFLAWDSTTLIKAVREGGSPPGSTPPAATAARTASPQSTSGPSGPPLQPSPAGASAALGPTIAEPAPRPHDVASNPATSPMAGHGPALPTVGGETVPPTSKACPRCGQSNPRRVRFCTSCGYCFVRLAVPQSNEPSPAQAAAADRTARREYRRTLPAFYRWRRVGISVITVMALILAGVVTGGNPGRSFKDGWYWLTKQYVAVTPVVAAVDPTAVVQGSDPARLVDGTVKEFTMNWAPGSVAACGPAPGTSWMTLSITSTRIRRIVVYPGLDRENPKRAMQPLPKSIAISFDGGPCRLLGLSTSPGPVDIDIDSGEAVSQVRVGIAEAYPVGQDAEQAISITEIVLKKYPD